MPPPHQTNFLGGIPAFWPLAPLEEMHLKNDSQRHTHTHKCVVRGRRGDSVVRMRLLFQRTWGSIPSTHVVTHNCLYLSSRGPNAPFWLSQAPSTHGVCLYTHRQTSQLILKKRILTSFDNSQGRKVLKQFVFPWLKQCYFIEFGNDL